MKGLHQSIIPAAIPAWRWVTVDMTSDDKARVEVHDEGDGNWLIRSSFNRDRVLRLTNVEIRQLVYIALFGQVQPAPESVGAEVGHGVSG